MLSVQANGSPNWSEKITKAFWRGRDSREERLKLVIMGRKNPDLFDAALTNFFFFKHDDSKYGPKAKHVSFFDFFKVSCNDFCSQYVCFCLLPLNSGIVVNSSTVQRSQAQRWFKHDSSHKSHQFHNSQMQRMLALLNPCLLHSTEIKFENRTVVLFCVFVSKTDLVIYFPYFPKSLVHYSSPLNVL